jgi:polar amino acid transport system substrate-binding protein
MTAARLCFVSLMGAVLLAACGEQTASVAPAGQREPAPVDAALAAANLAPTGTLRVTFLGANPVHARVDERTGKVTGPVVDLVEELSRRIGVPHAFVPCPTARCVIDAINSRQADIGFLAYEDARAAEVDYAGAYGLMHSSYLLPADSPLRASAEADKEGIRIGAVRGRSQQIYLSGNLAEAEVVIFEQVPGNEELERLLVAGELDAFGLNRESSLDVARAFPSLKVMEDSYFSVPQEFVVAKGQPAKVAALIAFTDELRERGLLRAALEKAGLLDSVGVAPRIVH